MMSDSHRRHKMFPAIMRGEGKRCFISNYLFPIKCLCYCKMLFLLLTTNKKKG